MPDRKHALDFTVYDLGGTDWIDYLKAFRLDSELELDDGKSLTDRYEEEVVVKSNDRFRGTLLVHQAAALKSNLDVTLWTIGGVAHLANLKDGTVTITNRNKDGSGVADLKESPHLLATSIQIEGDYLINLSSGVVAASLVKLAMSSTIADKSLAYSLAVGGVVLQGNGKLQRASHVVDEEDFQVQSATLKGTGTPTSVTSHSLIVSALTGTAAMAFTVTTGAGGYTGNLVIEQAVLQVKDAALLRADFDFKVFGQPTFVDPA
jgi:hypothetical protein